MVFYSTSCEDWTAIEDSSLESLRAYNSPFCIRGAVMDFLNPPYLGKSIIKKEHREQSPIPFLLQTSLSLSYLLYNLMSKKLFGKINKEKEENIEQEN